MESQGHGKGVCYVDKFALAVASSEQGSDGDIGEVFSHLPFLRVIKEVWKNVRLNDAMGLFGNAHAEVQVSFYFLCLYRIHGYWGFVLAEKLLSMED